MKDDHRNSLSVFLTSFLNATGTVQYHKIFQISQKLATDEKIYKILIKKIEEWMESKIESINEDKNMESSIIEFYNAYINIRPLLLKILSPIIHSINKNKKLKKAQKNYFQNKMDKIFRMNINKIKNYILTVLENNIRKIREIVYTDKSNGNIKRIKMDNFQFNRNYLQNKNYIKYKIDKIKLLYKIAEDNKIIIEINKEIIKNTILYYKNNNVVNLDGNNINNIIFYLTVINSIIETDRELNFYYNYIEIEKTFLNELAGALEDKMDFIFNSKYFYLYYNLFDKEYFNYKHFDDLDYSTTLPNLNCINNNVQTNSTFNNLDILYASLKKYFTAKKISTLKDFILIRKEHENPIIDKEIGDMINKNKDEIKNIIKYVDIIIRNLSKNKYKEIEEEIEYDNSIKFIEDYIKENIEEDPLSLDSIGSILDGNYNISQSLEEINSLEISKNINYNTKIILEVIFKEIKKIMKKYTHPFILEETLRYYMYNRLLTDRYKIEIEEYILLLIEYKFMMKKILKEFIKDKTIAYNKFYTANINIEYNYIKNNNEEENNIILSAENNFKDLKRKGMNLEVKEYLSIAEIEIEIDNKIINVKCIGIQLEIIIIIIKYKLLCFTIEEMIEKIENILKIPKSVIKNCINSMAELIEEMKTLEGNKFLNVIPKYLDLSAGAVKKGIKKEGYEILDSFIVRKVKNVKSLGYKKLIDEILKKGKEEKKKVEERIKNLEDRGFLRIEGENVFYEP